MAFVNTLLQELEPSSFGCFQAQTLYYGHVASLMRDDEAEAARCRAEALAIVSTAAWEAFSRRLPPWARLQEHRPPSALTVRMFGSLNVQTPTGRSVFGSSQGILPRQLLVSLILAPDGLTGDQLLKRLYAAGNERRKALISLIHRLRDSLGAALGDDAAVAAITYTPPRFHLSDGWPLVSDWARFREAHGAWLTMADTAERVAASQHVIDLYTGPLLTDMPDDPWLVSARQAVREQWLSVVSWYLTYLARNGEIEQALILIERAATVDPAVSRLQLRQTLTVL
jgi:DNA-binding SARP family transcriptional activator